MSEILTLEYNLAELPSSQHRAGLAGLVLMVEWAFGAESIGKNSKKGEPDKKGLFEIVRLEETMREF